MCAAAKVASSVMQVANLDRSVSYYCDVFSCRVALRERDATLLLTPDDFQIYMYVQKGASRRNMSNIASTTSCGPPIQKRNLRGSVSVYAHMMPPPSPRLSVE